MTWVAIALCFACQALMVTGQLLLKRGISGKKPRVPYFALGICSLTAWFFLWLGLMGKWDLSKLYPFEGLNPLLIALAACLMLKERLPAGAWIGLGLICAGVAVVAGS